MFIKEIYFSRRRQLRMLMEDYGGVIVLPSNNEAPMNYRSNTYRYRQDSTFNYFFSQMRDGIVGIIDLESGKDIIFGNDFTINDIVWMGNQPTIRQLAEECKISDIKPVNELLDFIADMIKKGKKIHYLPPYRDDTLIFLSELTGQNIDKTRRNASVELIKSVVALRAVKSGDEIAELDRICNVGVLMHLAVMKKCHTGEDEHNLAGIAEGIALSRAAGVSFPIILSQDGQTLHNPYHNKKLTGGRLLLVDMGAEAESGYSSDYTRTLPVSGRFTKKQREIYEIVLKANLDSIAMAKPDLLWRDVHFNACGIVVQGLKDLGLMKGDVKEAVQLGAHALFMPHGLGHALGMDVHDMESLGEDYVGYDENVKRSTVFGHASLRYGKALKVGNVLTVEPGIYFIPQLIDIWEAEGKFKDFINYEKVRQYIDFGGIRLEDDIVITHDGCRVLGNPLAKTMQEIEALLD
ncbi:MAG: aminopeptidase P family protein [Prevotellaceae bacterium]|jgi:Xaa-Pro aminopeptidase|nr:aminopeptidase P family protein [Prevotellaceae bacterium]